MQVSDINNGRALTQDEQYLVDQSQARAILKAMPLTLIANTFIAASSAAFIWKEDHDILIPVWSVCVVLSNMCRLASLPWLRRMSQQPRRARRVINILTASAFVGGVIWSSVAFLGAGLDTQGSHGLVVFILAGISAGAIIQSSACARPPMGMSVPALTAAIVALSMQGTFTALMVVLNLALFLVMLTRSSFMSEAAFIRTEIARIRSADLARSLQEANRKLERLANTDPLTGLGNRAAFNADLDEAVASALDGTHSAVLILFDLDRFKQINDTLGHTAGDMVLKTFASRLLAVTDGQDSVSRLGGDEFAIVIGGPNAFDRAVAVADIMLEAAGEPIDVGGRQIVVATSIGMAQAPQHARSAKALYESADTALYAAKQQGRQRVCVFETAMNAQLDRRRVVEFYVRHALEHALIEVRFAPQRHLQTGQIVGFQALPHWKVPQIGAVNTCEMVEAAAALGHSESLTRYIAERAAAFALRLRTLGRSDIAVSLNVSATEFHLYRVDAMLRDVVGAIGLPPAAMVVEVPEQAMHVADDLRSAIRTIGDAGFRLALDRFGTAHASLGQLAGMPLGYVKIAPGVSSGLATNPEKQLVMSAFVGIARALDVDLMADGIETEEQAVALRLLGCALGQGALQGGPMAADEAIRSLAPAVRQPAGIAAIA